MDVHDVLARLTSLGLRSSRLLSLVLMLAVWLALRVLDHHWDHLHANQTIPPPIIPYPTDLACLPCHCPLLCVPVLLQPSRYSESPPSLTHVPHDVASSTRSLHLLPGLPAPPDRLFDR